MTISMSGQRETAWGRQLARRGGEEGGCPTYSESDCYSDHSRGSGSEHELSRQFECLSKKDV